MEIIEKLHLRNHNQWEFDRHYVVLPEYYIDSIATSDFYIASIAYIEHTTAYIAPIATIRFLYSPYSEYRTHFYLSRPYQERYIVNWWGSYIWCLLGLSSL